MNRSSLQDKFPCMSEAERTARNYAKLAMIMMPMLGDALSPLMANDDQTKPSPVGEE